MKKILLVILLFVISSCGNTYKKEIPANDSVMFQIDTMMPLPTPAPAEEPTLIIAEIQKDSLKIRKSSSISKLDTTSVVRDLRKHIEVIDSQQKQLDSLLKMKKKK
ncbi:MAG: hypothetical protein GYA51_06450 [Candidatus Methanofastidiosa archaeon]|nr:hypothetical protein [Candidatus Methanofastidiosa archaeon]